MPNNRLVRLREELASGVHPGIPFQQVPLWKSGYNVRFSETGPEKMKGWTNPISSGLGVAPIRGMGQNLGASFQQLYFGDQTTLRKWVATGVTTEGTGYTGSANQTVLGPASSWSFQEWGSWMIATNGVDAPQIDKGAGFVALNVGSEFSTAEIILTRGPHTLAFNTSVNSKGFAWSDVGDPEDWVPTSANDAGSQVFREATSGIVAAKKLGESILAYTNEETFLVSFVGGDNVFGYRPAVTGVGALSKHSIVPVGNRHYGWGRQGLYVTDGVQFQRIDAPVRDFLEPSVNFSQSSKIHGYHDEENHCVTWYYPSTSGSGEPDRGISFDYEKNLWSPLDHGRTSSLERNTFDYPVTATASGEVFFENFGADADGVALSAEITTKALDAGDNDLYKEFDALRVGFEGGGLQYRMGCQEDTDDPIEWGTWTDVLGGVDFANERLAGRYITVGLRSTGLGDTWNISGLDIYGRIGGYR